MIKNLVRIAVVMTMIPAAVVGVAGPAKAWSYCSPSEFPGYIYIYGEQGYCGTQGTAGGLVGNCYTLIPAWNNWIASAGDRTSNIKVTFYNNSDCSGENFSLAAHTSHPNFYSSAVGINGMGKEASSYKLSYA
jgi:hypothetical protein